MGDMSLSTCCHTGMAWFRLVGDDDAFHGRPWGDDPTSTLDRSLLAGSRGMPVSQSLLRSFVPRFEWLRIASLSGALACWGSIGWAHPCTLGPCWCACFGLLQFWMVARQYREASHPEQKRLEGHVAPLSP